MTPTERLGRVIVVGATLVAALLSSAAAPTLHAQATERVIYASAVDAKTKAPLETLTAADVRVTEDDRAREVLRVTPATTPMPVAIVVDNQTQAQPHIGDLRRAVAAFVTRIQNVGPIAIITTADRPTILQDYTTDIARVQDAVNRIFPQPDSGATLLDAIPEVTRGLTRREEDRAAIVLVSFEFTEFSTRHFSEVLDDVEASGAALHAVVLRNQAANLLNDATRNRSVVLDRGVNESGGTRVDVLTSLSFTNALEQIANVLVRQHRVVYARPQQLIPPERVAITSTRDGVTITGTPARGQKDR
ncbi:MAG: hypothetical protein IT178_13695 [Acidobacteria bacterium]|nr:hypothetical protein [Acidobacteriota bacterium]